MSFGIVRVQKMTSGSVKGIEIHDQRQKESKTNQDINHEKTEQNYNLVENNALSYQQKIKERISHLDLKKAIRKDAIVMGQVLVTSDKSFFENLNKEQQKEFFKSSFEFLEERYGKENVVSAVVHMDEKTPHMHFNFVPVTDDGRLSAKSVLNRQGLIEQQTSFYKQVGKLYGLERGVEGGTKKHFEMSDLKVRTALEEVSNAKIEVEKLNKQITKLIDRRNALDGQIKSLKGMAMDIKDMEAIQPEKTITGALRGVSLEQIQSLKKTAVTMVKNFDIRNEQYNNLLEEHKPLIAKENKLTKENLQLKRNIYDLKAEFLKIKSNINVLPNEIKVQVLTPAKPSKPLEEEMRHLSNSDKLIRLTEFNRSERPQQIQRTKKHEMER